MSKNNQVLALGHSPRNGKAFQPKLSDLGSKYEKKFEEVRKVYAPNAYPEQFLRQLIRNNEFMGEMETPITNLQELKQEIDYLLSSSNKDVKSATVKAGPDKYDDLKNAIKGTELMVEDYGDDTIFVELKDAYEGLEDGVVGIQYDASTGEFTVYDPAEGGGFSGDPQVERLKKQLENLIKKGVTKQNAKQVEQSLKKINDLLLKQVGASASTRNAADEYSKRRNARLVKMGLDTTTKKIEKLQETLDMVAASLEAKRKHKLAYELDAISAKLSKVSAAPEPLRIIKIADSTELGDSEDALVKILGQNTACEFQFSAALMKRLADVDLADAIPTKSVGGKLVEYQLDGAKVYSRYETAFYAKDKQTAEKFLNALHAKFPGSGPDDGGADWA